MRSRCSPERRPSVLILDEPTNGLDLAAEEVVARDQIFIGAAVSQASTVGIALALGLGSWAATEGLEWLHADAFLAAMAVVSSVVAAQ
jgi:ABC-type Mn2+/Zn2+ transport system permease subunit